MQTELRILRYDPEHDSKPHQETYRVNAEPMDRVLDLLHKVKDEQDGTLTFRRSARSASTSWARRSRSRRCPGCRS